MVIREAYWVQRDILAGYEGTGGVGVGLRISGVKDPELIKVCAFGHRRAGRQASRSSCRGRSGGGTCPKVGGKASFISTPNSGAGAKWVKLREGLRSPKVRPRELMERGMLG